MPAAASASPEIPGASSAPPSSPPPVKSAATPFLSLPVLRRTHTGLLRRQRSEAGTTPPTVEEIVNFMDRARAMGRHFAAPESRDAIQGLIDYWYGILMLGDRKGVGELGSLNLDEFEGDSIETPDADSAPETQARARALLDAKVQAFEAQLLDRDRPLLRRLLLRLFTLSAARNHVEFTHLSQTDEFLGDPAAANLATAMLSAGLLKTEATDSGSEAAYVLADPGLQQSWPAFDAIVEERLSLRDMTAGWEKSGKSSSALLAGGPLLDLAADYVNLRPAEAHFVSESRQSATQREKERQARMKERQVQMKKAIWILSGLVGCVLILLGGVYWLMGQERVARENALKSASEATTAKVEAESAAKLAKAAEERALTAADKATKAAEEERAARQAEAAAVALASEQARQSEAELREQLDASNQSAAEMRTIVENARRAVDGIEELDKSLTTRLRPQERKTFAAALGNLKESLKQTEKSAATAAARDEAIGSAVQDEVNNPRPRLVKVLQGHRQPITAIAFAKDGKLATAGEDNLVRVWTSEGASFTEPITGSSAEGVNCLAFSPDQEGRWLAIGSKGSTVRLRDFANNTSRAYAGHRDSIINVSFSTDGSKVLSASADKTIQIWSPVNDLLIQNFGPTDSLINWTVFNGDSTRVVGALEGNEALVWAVGSDAAPLRLPRAGPVKRAVFSPNGEAILTSSLDNTVAVWRPSASSSDDLPLVWSESISGPVFQAVFSPDGSQVACAGGDHTVKILEARTGKRLRDLQGHRGAVSHVTYHPSGKVLLTGSLDSTAKLWFGSETEARYTLEGHTGRITAVAFNAVGGQIATGSQDGTVQLWNFREDADQPPLSIEVTGWCLYGWLDTGFAGASPRLRAQSLAPLTGERDAIPSEGLEAEAEAIMNVRDEIKPGANKRWDQGKPIGLLRKGERVKVLQVLWDKDMVMQPQAVWIKFKKL